MMIDRDIRKEIFSDIKRIVIKVGSSILASTERGLHYNVFSQLAKEISDLKRQGYEIALVSSGAIAAGMEKLGLKSRPISITQKQATAAIGQTRLMNIYEKFFSRHQQMVAQILLTHDDLAHRKRFLNARNTMLNLLQLGIIPIINENDTVVVDEIKFGDNDNLSALITNLIEADLLIILTDINGLFNSDPKLNKNAKCISLVKDIDELDIKGNFEDSNKGKWSVGGVTSKIQAAQKASRFGIPTVIALGTKRNIIHQILKGEEVGTLILPKKITLSSRKHWIAFNLKPKGDLVVDEGAKKAIVQKGKSLLPSGIVKIRGVFERGDSVTLIGPKGKEFARGIVNYNSQELEKIKGLKTDEIEKYLGYKYSDEVIHRDDLVVL